MSPFVYQPLITVRTWHNWATYFTFVRLRKSGQPFLAYHPGLVRDKLAYHGCAELFQVNFFNLLHLYSLIEQPDTLSPSNLCSQVTWRIVLNGGIGFWLYSSFQSLKDLHSELIQYRRAQMIKQKFISEELIVDSRVRRDKGLCPLMPEEVETKAFSNDVKIAYMVSCESWVCLGNMWPLYVWILGVPNEDRYGYSSISFYV